MSHRNEACHIGDEACDLVGNNMGDGTQDPVMSCKNKTYHVEMRHVI